MRQLSLEASTCFRHFHQVVLHISRNATAIPDTSIGDFSHGTRSA